MTGLIAGARVGAAGLIGEDYATGQRHRKTLASGVKPISPLTPLPRTIVIAGMESGSEDQPRLTGAERGKLRSLAQTLDPKVFVGKAGVNAGIAKLLEEAFRNADLVKVRFTAEREIMDAQAKELAGLTESEVIGSVGRTATFFKLGADIE